MTFAGVPGRWMAFAVVLVGFAAGCDQAVPAGRPIPAAQIEEQGLAIGIDGTNIGPTPICSGGCNDNNPCTNDACIDGICEHVPNSNACDDGNPCTGNICGKGVCMVIATATCREDQCNNAVCDGRGGCLRSPKTGAACNDANLCTYGELCDGTGVCGGGKEVVCTSDACVQRTCNGTATCAVTPKTGTTCEDGNPCTHGDTCDSGGVCRPGTAVVCQDDACNSRVCDGAGGCRTTPRSGAVCSDGDACSFGDRCDSTGVCQGGSKVTCTSDACNTRVCNGTATCKVIPRAGNRCDDANACSHDDVCNAEGTCAGTAIVCASDETAERTCNGGPTCTVKPRPGVACDDGNPCTQGDVRMADGSCRGMPYTCELGACLVSSVCDGKGGCTSVSKPDETGCDADKSKCTPRDVCRGGVCVPDPRPVKCIERDCNTVACDAETGNCQYQPTSGEACGVSGCFAAGTCEAGVCSGKPKDCSAFGGACSEGICDATTGECVGAPKPNGTSCAPGGACTAQATCNFGVCELAPATCPTASAACKVAACNPDNGQCTEAARPVGSPCDPGNSCISEAICDTTGACVGMPAANGEPCTAAGGQIGACVSGACVASGTLPNQPVDGGQGQDAGPDASPSIGSKAAPKKSGCSFGGPPGEAPWLGLLLGLALFGLARRR